MNLVLFPQICLLCGIGKINIDWVQVAIFFAAVAAIWASWSSSGRMYEERRIHLYAKLDATLAHLRQFILDLGMHSKNQISYPWNIALRKNDVENFKIEEAEKVEFAILDIKHHESGMSMVGIPMQIQRWYGQKTVLDKGGRECVEIPNDFERIRKQEIVNSLIRNIMVATKGLEKEMPKWVKNHKETNRKLDEEWTKQYNASIQTTPQQKDTP